MPSPLLPARIARQSMRKVVQFSGTLDRLSGMAKPLES
jgi:hypothetical protein